MKTRRVLVPFRDLDVGCVADRSRAFLLPSLGAVVSRVRAAFLYAARADARSVVRAVLVALALLLAVSCGSSDGTGEEVRSTIPKNGETGIDPRAIVAIHLSDIMTGADDNLDPELIRVVGDLTDGDYQGTITVAKWSSDVLPGMTIDEFSPTSVTPGEGQQAPELDALVFLLAGGENFKQGETITVKVSKHVSARGRTLNRTKRFSFVIRESGMGTEDLRVTRTNPRPQARGISLSSLVKATFNRDQDLTGLDDGLTLRGEQSGVHLNVDALFTNSAGFDTEITQRLASGDSFLPGEVVEATWNRNLEDSEGTALNPYLVRFQVESGLVNGGWDSGLAALNPVAGPPVSVLTADFLPGVDGVEFVVVTAGSVELFEQSEENVWTSRGVGIVGRGGMTVIDAGLIDLNRDGLYEISVLLASDSAARIITFELDEDGVLVQQADEAEVAAGGATALHVADLDASGDPELLVLHRSSSSLGSITVFQRTLIPPDPDSINPLDPSTLMPRPALEPVENAIPSFKEASRVEAVDLSGDGRPDLVAQNVAGGITVYRNIGSASSPFSFRLAKELRGRSGGSLDVMAWTVADVDSDFDSDLVVWDSAGALLYVNKLATLSGETVQGSDLASGDAEPQPLPPLDLTLSGPSLARALEFDGDPFLDYVVAQPSGAVTLLLGATQDGTAFDRMTLDGGGELPVNLALADVSGDAGQDLILYGGGSSLPVLYLSQDVEAPARPAPHAFRIVVEPREGEDPSLLFVRAEGDIKEVFLGYSLALDYDESVLTYERFEIPAGFQAKANFVTCPDESGAGCPGGVSVRMQYRSEVSGGLPRDELRLGWFVFRLPTVTESSATELRLVSFEEGDETFDNTVTVLDSGTTFEVVPMLPEELSVEILPPAPDDLVASCTVVERRAADMDVRVSWDSPAGRTFTGFTIFAGGSQVMTASGSATSVQFSTTLTGVVNIDVQGRTDADVFSADCDVIGVHEPEVRCEVVNASENRVTWSLSHSADSFRIYRNGQLINTVAGTAREFRDLNPSAAGSDLYEVEAVVSGASGRRGACLEGPIGDPDTAFTQPPRNLSAALRSKGSSNDPNEVRAGWENGEGYTSLFVALRRASEGAPRPEDEFEIGGTSTEYIFSGDPDSGGIPPNEYIVSVRGAVGGMSSDAVDSNRVTVNVPPLATRLTCSVIDDGDIRMAWDRVWQGYTDLQVSIEHRIDGVPQGTFLESIGLDRTEYVYTPPLPLGTYHVELVASYIDPLLPPALQPRPELMRRACEVLDFDTGMLLGGAEVGGQRRIETGVGIPRVEIPVRARALATVTGFAFALEYPDFLTGDPLELEIDHLGAVSAMTVTPLGDGRERVEVTVTGVRILPDQDGDGAADGEVALATLVGGVPAEFSWAGEYPINFAGTPTLTFAGAPGEADRLTEVAAEDGSLLVVSSYVLGEVVEIPAGSREVIPFTVFGTFPERAPDYRLNSFVIHLRFNRDELEFLETTEADQDGSAVAGRGAFFPPTPEARARANQTGEVTMPWVGFDLQNLAAGFTFLEPGILHNLATFNFRSKVPADSTAVFSSIEFVHDSGARNPTVFLAEFDDPEVSDPEGFFGGGVRIASAAAELSLLAIDPATGPIDGGTRAALRGTGFSRLDRDRIAVRLVMGDEPGAVHLPVAPEDIVAITENEIQFIVPDSGLRPLVGTPSSFAADVFLDIDPDGTLSLPDGYAYEYPRLTGADRDSGQADGFQLMVLQGFGFPQDSRVEFVFAGEAIEAAINRVAADGRSVQITIPDLRGHIGELATIEVLVPALNDLSLRLDSFFSVLDGGAQPELSVLGVLPPTGVICGGYEATIRGTEFRPSMQVFFGDEEAIGLIVDDATTARVMVPPVPEGTTTVPVRVVDGAIMDTLDDAFTYEHPAPPFRRGDVTEDGAISVVDVVRLSDILVGAAVNLPANLDSADANDDSVIDGGDVTKLTATLFGDRLPLPEPFLEPGLDPTPDSITSCPGTF